MEGRKEGKTTQNCRHRSYQSPVLADIDDPQGDICLYISSRSPPARVINHLSSFAVVILMVAKHQLLSDLMTLQS
jgi:hypothetical protein